MNIPRFIFLVLFINFQIPAVCQYLSHLHAGRNDALFTTYAAPPSRSAYKNDQGYQFQWNDGEMGVEFISKDGPNFGIAFRSGNRMVFRLSELFSEPVVTTSYSDLVRYFYYPFKDIRVEVLFAVYSSTCNILQYRVVNEGHFPVSFSALPYLCYPSPDSLEDISRCENPAGYTYKLIKKRDGWMVEHNIPLSDTLAGRYTLTGCDTLTGWSFVQSTSGGVNEKETDQFSGIIRSMAVQKRASRFIKGIISTFSINLLPGASTAFRVVSGLQAAGLPEPARNRAWNHELREMALPDRFDPEQLVKDDELAYARIPNLNFDCRDKEMLYWSAFSLMRQCMMPAEGKCKHNYYVFSREPKWGWGYGGQVFHESLVMMAYTFMDPEGAMNSQRIFMDRQRPDGYINYRSGPYLDETIETNGQSTSSAPWFNYENLEVYRVTGNRQFLRQAYDSGKKFYQYYIANRDTDKDGLCEWGAHAELESVRDARVAVWDKVGWAANFEGPDLNSMLVMEAKSLSEMAGILGFQAESKQFADDAAHRTALINSTLWDDATRFYYNVDKTNHTFGYKLPGDLKIKEIIGFLPLWAGVADKKRAGYLVAKMKDTAEFWRPYGVPTLTASSDYYCPIGYWNGPVWVQWEYLICRGLRDYGYKKDAAALSGKVLANMIYHLKKDHVFWEFYSADDLQAGWNKSYIWAGIAARFLMDE
ncbi:MAG: trehalase family glycosidase [Bacteroidota bacterium]